jgi:hypothetical protein
LENIAMDLEVIRRPLRYQTRRLRPGDGFVASDGHARLLIAIKRAIPARPISPFDHDGDGHEGGSLPAAQRVLDDLRAEAEAAGVKVNRRWGERRLREEIAKAVAEAES